MSDGGMGSLQLFRKGEPPRERHLGRKLSDVQFDDVDGVAVLASLNVDQRGELFELDIWKTNFSATIALPGPTAG